MHGLIFVVYNTHMNAKSVAFVGESNKRTGGQSEILPGWVDLAVRVLLCQFRELAGWQSANFAAPHWRIYWNRDPGAAVVHGGKRIPLVPERFMVIPPETPYAPELSRTVGHFYLHFTMHPRLDAPRMIHTFPAEGEMLSAVQELMPLVGEGGGHALRVSVLCQYLAHAVLARIPVTQLQHVYADRRIEQAIQGMQDRLGEKLLNDDLAAESGMNTNAFIRLFRETTGETPQAFLTRLRIERACLRLLYTDASMEEIAEEVGFCDRYHFSRTFGRLRGMGPAAFRRLRDAGQTAEG